MADVSFPKGTSAVMHPTICLIMMLALAKGWLTNFYLDDISNNKTIFIHTLIFRNLPAIL